MDQIKNQLFFHLQLSFRSVSSTVETKRDQVRRILQLPPSNTSDNEPSAAREMETAITAYLRRATDTFDLSKNVEVRLRTNSKIQMTSSRRDLALVETDKDSWAGNANVEHSWKILPRLQYLSSYISISILFRISMDLCMQHTLVIPTSTATYEFVVLFRISMNLLLSFMCKVRLLLLW